MALWDKIGSTGDVEDRRSMSPVGLSFSGAGLMGVVLLVAINLLAGGSVDVNDVLSQLQNTQVQQQTADSSVPKQEDDYKTFVSKVLGSNNDTWSQYFKENGKTYQPPKLVLFRGLTQSACGGAQSAVGPHYCPYDETVYLDETFFDVLTKQLGAKGGDVAQAYVISHEVGHHVQNRLGIMEAVQDGSNVSSVKLELQADCFAGVWANSVNHLGVIQEGEIDEAIDAAKSVGDDKIQQQTQGQVNPEQWTHGSSAERVKWFKTGYQTGRPATCNTFR